MQIGIVLPQTSAAGADVASLRRYLAFVDDAGFDSLWVTEQLFGPAARFDPLSLIAYAAALTRRVRLGTAVLLAALRSPVLLAKEIASLDHLSEGRLTLGVGLSGDRSIYPAVGLRTEDRGRRLERGIELMQRLWTEPEVSETEFWQLERVQMEPRPVQRPHPPILFGASSQPALERAVRLGQGWIGAGAASTERYLAELGRVRALAAGRADFVCGKRVYIAIDDDRTRARDRLRAWFGRTYAGRPPESVDAVAVYGSLAHCTDELRRFTDAGTDLLILNPVFDEIEQANTLAALLRG